MTHDKPLPTLRQLSPGSDSGAAAPSSRAPAESAARALSDPHPPVRSLYIHTPFCVHKCHYCDFYSFVDTRDQQAAYLDRLIDELARLAPHAADASGTPLPLHTIFIGGGTPSLLRTDLWQRLLAALRERFDLSLMGAGSADAPASHRGEFTVECNPESTTPDLLAALVAGGVNRVSLGAQSFNEKHLKTLERWHAVDSVERAVSVVKAAGVPRVSVDLIYAVPGQTLEEWGSDLRRALALGVTHLSCYNLTYEPNTAMTVRLRRGEFTPTGEDLEADMFTLAGETLAAAGLARYEVSNYARPGDESRHNLAYWRQEQWLAAGPSASGHVYAGANATPLTGAHRWKNAPNLNTYLRSAGYAPIIDHEPPDPARAIRERLMMGLRVAEGVAAAEILAAAEHLAPGAASKLQARAARLAGDGLLETAAHRWRVTPRGWLLADFVAKQMMAVIETNA